MQVGDVINWNRIDKFGQLIIFNMQNFKDKPSLPGNKFDVNSLGNTFHSFGAAIKVHKNCTLSELRAAVHQIKGEDFSRQKYIAVAIFTHGSNKRNLEANDGSFDLDDDIIRPISRNPTLMNKPKLFIVDSCRGAMRQSVPKQSNKLIMRFYGASEGLKSTSADSTGSFFIKVFCEKLFKYGDDRTTKKIMEKTIKAVHLGSNGKQSPTIDHNFTDVEADNFFLGLGPRGSFRANLRRRSSSDDPALLKEMFNKFLVN